MKFVAIAVRPTWSLDKELQPYLSTFPPEFYKNMFRLRGLPYSTESGVKRPQYFGKLTNDVVYQRLAPGVLAELKAVQAKTPAGNPQHKLFQRLTRNIGYPKLREHLGAVVMLMRLSDDWDDFMAKLNLFHPKFDGQGRFELDIPVSEEGRRRRPAGWDLEE